MSGVEVIAVSTPAEMDRFIRLPCALYAADPNFVPPLLLERAGGALAQEESVLPACRGEVLAGARATAATSAGSARRSTGW